jgi:hypothetical protein
MNLCELLGIQFPLLNAPMANGAGGALAKQVSLAVALVPLVLVTATNNG